MDFKERLAAAIRGSGLTQKQVAAKLGVAPSMVGFWLRGAEPRRPTYERILDAFPELREPVKAAS